MDPIDTRSQHDDAGVRLAALLSAALLLGACSQAKTPANASRPPEVTVVTVHKTSVPVAIDLPGRTSAYYVAQVRARVDGIVLRRTYKEGSDVKAGQTLYQIDPAPYIAALDSAKATLQSAEANVVAQKAQAERFKTLVAGNAVSKQDYDNAVAAEGQAEAAVASGRAAVDTAQINLGYTNVLSPISGRSGISMVTEGAYVQASAATLMTTIQQIDPIYVDLTQSSVQGLRLRRDVASGKVKLSGPNQAKVKLFLEDGREYRETGSLQTTDITVDQATGTVTVRTLLPNRKSLLLPGMFVRARIEEGVNEDAFLVPQAGVTHDPKGQANALVVGPDNKATLRTLRLAGTRGDQWVVQGGLEDGDRVIVAGLQRVQPGTTVVATESPTAAPN
ncbi:MAG TPA: efflux RND transporter periplasmic adaptor subunit, partial [Casimicrobiaceae bacterium]|nr:efflux RND transporter periplasmic adaptor subunit [Casimicrobiaceae bacterium]